MELCHLQIIILINIINVFLGLLNGSVKKNTTSLLLDIIELITIKVMIIIVIIIVVIILPLILRCSRKKDPDTRTLIAIKFWLHSFLKI